MNTSVQELQKLRGLLFPVCVAYLVALMKGQTLTPLQYAVLVAGVTKALSKHGLANQMETQLQFAPISRETVSPSFLVSLSLLAEVENGSGVEIDIQSNRQKLILDAAEMISVRQTMSENLALINP